jgi:hypothetical protein
MDAGSGRLSPEDVLAIFDFSNDTLLGIAERLESSDTFEDLIKREIELDQVWSRVDTVIANLRADRTVNVDHLAAVEKMGALVYEAHDLAAEGLSKAAAERLREAMVLGY